MSNMQEKINEILTDLYNLDPSFKQYEGRLKELIVKLLEAKPDTKFDYQFAQMLRRQLLQEVPKPKFASEISSIKHQLTRRLSFAGALVAICLVLFATTLYVNDKNGNQISFFSPGVKITSAGERAFGELTEVSVENKQEGLGAGSGGRGSATASPLVVAPDGKPIPLPPDYVVYRYVYKGEELKLGDTKREVLRRIKGDAATLDGLLETMNLGLVNLRSFANLKVQSLNLFEEGNKGYNITIDSYQGSIYISRYWDQVALGGYAKDLACPMDASCPEVYRPVSIDEVPSDAQAISIALEFVTTHSIPTDAYGQPEVLNQWREYYERETDKSLIYVPDMVTVVFPLIVNGNSIYDESGNKVGLMVSIEVRNRQVMSVWELNTLNYQSSMYDAETDGAKILKIAEGGGMYGYDYYPGARVVDVQLDTPTVELIRVWNYKDNDSQELLIPSLAFPVVDPPADGPYYKKTVIVSLIKEILDQPKQSLPPHATY